MCGEYAVLEDGFQPLRGKDDLIFDDSGTLISRKVNQLPPNPQDRSFIGVLTKISRHPTSRIQVIQFNPDSWLKGALADLFTTNFSAEHATASDST
jgi:hypothetical protein